MLVTLSTVIGIVLVFSLYDYISSKSWLMVTADDRNESVFENRNKRYGAYKIRRDYNMLVILITVSVSAAVGATYGVTELFGSGDVKKEKKKAVVVNMDTFANDDKKDDKIEEPLEKVIPEDQKTLAFLPPKIVDKPTDQEMATQDELTQTNAGSTTQNGDPLGQGGSPEPEPEPVKPPEPEPILEIVEEEAEFPGGQGELAKYLMKNIKYPEMALDAGIGGRVYLRFVVSSSGNISNVKVTRGIADCKECDDEAVRVVRGMPSWKPGKNNGKPVNMWYNLPVKFTPG